MSIQLPKLLFVGAGNIAQSVMKGLVKNRPGFSDSILATAPTMKNLNVVKSTIGCHVTLLENANIPVSDFKPEFIFLCVKPQVLVSTMASQKPNNRLRDLLFSLEPDCTIVSLLAGIKSDYLSSVIARAPESIVRAMLNTAAEVGASGVLYHSKPDLGTDKIEKLEFIFKHLGNACISLDDEKLMDVATGVCGSGIAFFYEMIQSISDVAVKNGLSRADATLIATQLSKGAGEMLLAKASHPYQLRDQVSSPAGTTIYGLSSWHDNSTSQKIGRAVQEAIDRAKSLSQITETTLGKQNI